MKQNNIEIAIYTYTVRFPPTVKLDFFFSTLSLPSLNRKATMGRKFSCLGLQQSVATADNIMQAI